MGAMHRRDILRVLGLAGGVGMLEGGNAALAAGPTPHKAGLHLPSVRPHVATSAATTWYVDPVNGNDSNAGTSSSTPVQTIMGGIVPKWGTAAPVLGGTTTIELLNPQSVGQEAIVLSPIMINGSNFAIIGQPSAAGTAFSPSSVTPKSRGTPGTLLQLQGMPSNAAPGMLLVNTTKGSSAFVDSILSGTGVVTQPLANTGLQTVTASPNYAGDDTWSASDVYQLYSLPTLNLKVLQPQGGDSDPMRGSPVCWLQNIYIPDVSGAAGSSTIELALGASSLVVSCCRVDPYYVSSSSGAGVAVAANCWLNGGGTLRGAVMMGGAINTALANDATFECLARADGDAIVHGNCQISEANTTFGVVYIDSTLLVTHGATLLVAPGSSVCQIWGPGGVNLIGPHAGVQNGSGGSWAKCLTVSGLKIEGATTGSAYQAGGWSDGITLTSANLDGYGGLQNPYTGSRYGGATATTILSSYYVDPVNGSDAGTGASASPFKSLGRVRSIMGRRTASAPMTIYLLNNTTENLVVDWGQTEEEEGVNQLTVIGSTSGQYTGTFTTGTTSYTPGLVGASGAFGVVVDPGIPTGAWGTSGLIGSHFTITNGPRSGMVGIIIGQVPATPTAAYYLPVSSVGWPPSNAMPQAGDTYTVYSLATITGQVELWSKTSVVLQNIRVDNSSNPTANVVELLGGSTLLTRGCHFKGTTSTQRGGYWQAQQCHFEFTGGPSTLTVSDGAFFDNFGNLFNGGFITASTASTVDIVGNTVVTGTTGSPALSLQLGSMARVPYGTSGYGWVCWLNSPGPAVHLNGSSKILCEQERFWGTLAGSPEYALGIDEGAGLYYGRGLAPQFAGASYLLDLGSTLFAASTLPVNMPPHGCVWDLTVLNSQTDVGSSATGTHRCGGVSRIAWASTGITVGTTCAATGQDSMAAGNNCNALASASVALGFYSLSESFGQIAEGGAISDRSAQAGHSQGARMYAGVQTTDATPRQLLASDGNPPLIGDTRSYAFRILVVARQSGSSTARAMWDIVGLISRGTGASSVTLDGASGTAAPAFSSGSVSGWAVSLAADTTAGGYAITVTGASSTTLNWHAYITQSMVFA
jgi:hypothetical protein